MSVPLGVGVPEGTIWRAAAGAVLLSAGNWCGEVRTKGSINADHITLGVKLDSESTHFSFRSGKEVLPGDVYALARGDAVDYRVGGRIRYAFISLNPELLLIQGGEDALRADVAFWERRRWFCASPSLRTLIARSVDALVMQFCQAERLMGAQALRQLQCDLVEPFLWAFVFGERNAHERTALSAAAIVRRAEHWMDGQPPEAIQVADLCRALGLTRRTLHRAFNETLGMGPIRYLTLRRLAAVRAALRQSEPDSTTVTETATRFGFWELGRFAKNYRHVFAESPSETLAKGTKRSANSGRGKSHVSTATDRLRRSTRASPPLWHRLHS